MSNLEAARSGDRRRALEVLRDTLAEQIDTTESATHAQLAAQYRAVLADLAALSLGEEGSDAESIANTVALRLAHSVPSSNARRGGRLRPSG